MDRKSKDLLSEAIAEANAVREIAYKNAEAALKETFQDRIQSMVSKSLQVEEEEEEFPEENEEEFEEGTYASEDDFEKEFSEMRGEDGIEDEFEEARKRKEAEPEEEEEPEKEPSEEDDEMEENQDMDDEDLELEAIIRELEAQIEEASKEEEEEPEEELEEASDSSKIGSGDNKMPDKKASSSAASEDPEKLQKGNQNKAEKAQQMKEEITLETILEEFFGEGAEEDDEKEEDDDAKEKVEELQRKLKEAYRAIRKMKSTLNEVNLLNAKLFYSNKIFKTFNLNENQKMRVIENFDRAGTVRETKLVYATLVESYGIVGKKRRKMTESYASKAVGSTKPSRKVLQEGSDLAQRFRKLAKIQK